MPPILAPADLHNRFESSLEDADLARLIAGAQGAIERVAGPLEAVTEIRRGGSSVIILPRLVASIVAVREAGDDFDLDPADWFLRSDRRSVDRLATGPNARALWHGPVAFEVQPIDDLEERRAIAIKLIELEVSRTPGLLGFTEGNWSIQFPNGETWGATRQDLLAQLDSPWSFG